jgi:hypothetical protein
MPTAYPAVATVATAVAADSLTPAVADQQGRDRLREVGARDPARQSHEHDEAAGQSFGHANEGDPSGRRAPEVE